jgi:cysteine desulfurase
MSAQPIYLDNNATTPVAPEALEAMLPYMMDRYGNPSSTHRLGVEAREAMILARAAVAELIGTKPAEVAFTSGCTESNHLAILGALAFSRKQHIVSSTVEHPSTLMLLRDLERQGFEVTLLAVDGDGQLDTGEFERVLSVKTALVTLVWANNETGVLFPIARLAQIAKSRGILFHTDAAQVVGRIPVDMRTSHVDLMSFSGHKFHSPKGIGGLFVRSGLNWPALLRGHQERRRRGGTENLPAIVALGAACRLAGERMVRDSEYISGLRERLERGIVTSLPWASINGGNSQRLPNTANICFGTVDGEAILARLDRADICASSGSACSSGGTEPSHVLTAMGLGRDRASSSIRFSLSRYTTEAQIDRVLEVLPPILRELAAEEPASAAF